MLADFLVHDAHPLQLTYEIPEDKDAEMPRVGQIYVLSVRQKIVVGLLWSFRTDKPDFPCLPVISRLSWVEELPESILALINWIAQYYLVTPARASEFIAPGFLWKVSEIASRDKRFKKLITKYAPTPILNHEFLKAAFLNSDFPYLLHNEEVVPFCELNPLNDEQEKIVNEILNFASGDDKKRVTLLQGVTGSGKTEVYLKLSQDFVANGKNVLILVPEIALTPQMTRRFRSYFQNKLAILHSGLTENDFEREWFRVHCGVVQVVLGVRNTVFAPLKNIGLIIVDEEHDGSYKSNETLMFHARDLAVVRGQIESCSTHTVLGSATPSLESYLNASFFKKYNYLKLGKSFSNNKANIEIIDERPYLGYKTDPKKPKMLRSSQLNFKTPIITPPVIERLKENKEKGQQSMVILNRRGFVNYALCVGCGSPFSCPNCSVSTTLHNRGQLEICHYCDFRTEIRECCSVCSNTQKIFMGAGTQNIEAELSEVLPDLKFARLDRDTLTSQSRLIEILNQFRNKEIDCLIGTQILSKGHDFTNVTLVCLLHIEDSLFLPDYRAGERTFQLLLQAIGRVGRGKLPGTVLIQSLIPSHPIFEFAMNGDIEHFLLREKDTRTVGWHPPFSRQILCEFSHKKAEKALESAQSVRAQLIDYWRENKISSLDLRIAGPYPATLEKLNNIFRFHFSIYCHKKLKPSQLFPKSILEDKKLVTIMKVDVDPQSFF